MSEFTILGRKRVTGYYEGVCDTDVLVNAAGNLLQQPGVYFVRAPVTVAEINAALADSRYNVVEIVSGTHSLTGTINVAEGKTLKGGGAQGTWPSSAGDTVLQWSGNGTCIELCHSILKDLTVDLTLHNVGNGVAAINQSSASCNHAVIRNVKMLGLGQYAGAVNGAIGVKISTGNLTNVNIVGLGKQAIGFYLTTPSPWISRWVQNVLKECSAGNPVTEVAGGAVGYLLDADNWTIKDSSASWIDGPAFRVNGGTNWQILDKLTGRLCAFGIDWTSAPTSGVLKNCIMESNVGSNYNVSNAGAGASCQTHNNLSISSGAADVFNWGNNFNNT